MIDREKVIANLTRCQDGLCDECDLEHASHYVWDCEVQDQLINDALELLKEQETVSGWVSVKDRLPEEDADVLVWNELGIEIAAYTTNPVKRWYSYTGQEVFAKYWMQLPEPPKEDDA